MIAVRSGIFKGVFYGWTALFCILYLPLFWMPRNGLIAFQGIWSRGVRVILRLIMNIRLEVRGVENIPHGGALIAMKHQSSFDTFVMHTVVSHPAFVMKKELLKIPLYGRFCLNTGMIPVDREGGLRALKKLMQDSAQSISEDRQLIIFPEGSRSLPGQKVEYQPGIFGIYKHTQHAVIPVALNSGVYWPKKGHLVPGGVIVFEFLSPIEPGMDKDSFMAALENKIEAASLALLENSDIQKIEQ
ncbi:MAG: 1-acyl-sn-glycerol-3-phosphate acyltransferase [Alphaproteobacteria bacterium]|nr:1-acyl-sn-glycerol-3-phosphate acyltransferase [Alphaproteobacteria bacterium]HPF45465.1 lysophospholipid acyltransferase family protein [Emcibacteraceae bacterium]HRW28574.1 lysophospholipid acyltransferase family protein [Emcibacteraceae bacterium]